MGQNNQKDQKGPKMTAAVMLVQNNQNNQKIWSSQISYTILKVRFFWDTLYLEFIAPQALSTKRTVSLHNSNSIAIIYGGQNRQISPTLLIFLGF